jgi:hypothetical protein
MHIYFLTRGIKHDVERFINELSAKYLPFNYKGEKSLVQVAVRPIQLWEVVFPEEHKDTMLRSLFNEKLGQKRGEPFHKRHKKFIYVLRKILGVQEIPYFDKEGDIIPFYDENIDKTAIGIKEDKRDNDNTEIL